MLVVKNVTTSTLYPQKYSFLLGGYPNQYGSSPMKPGGLSWKDCAMVPGMDHALCFAFRSDNQGPPVDYKVSLLLVMIAISRVQQ